MQNNNLERVHLVSALWERFNYASRTRLYPFRSKSCARVEFACAHSEALLDYLPGKRDRSTIYRLNLIKLYRREIRNWQIWLWRIAQEGIDSETLYSEKQRKRETRERNPALDGESMKKSPGWNGQEESVKEKGLVRDWNRKTMNTGGIENRT
ncbi:hypothetical protein TNCV_3047331 [Trichonephila clavipes]|nr:hypothetical protein TNCV_3047331 [Trichonephila clavipes]